MHSSSRGRWSLVHRLLQIRYFGYRELVAGRVTLSVLLVPLLALGLKRLYRAIRYHVLRGTHIRNGAANCCLCNKDLGASLRCRVPPTGGSRCHISCVIDTGRATSVKLPPQFVKDIRDLVQQSPSLLHRDPAIRMSFEDLRLCKPDQICGPSPAPPLSAIFILEGIREIRISSCGIRTLPAQIGRMQGLSSLVLMSLELSQIPKEVGDLTSLTQLFLTGNFLRELPEAIGALPALQDVYLDSNQLQVLPRFMSPKLKMFSAPGNLLREGPCLAVAPQRVEIHGNAISALQQDGSGWDQLKTLKVMGNKLTALPKKMATEFRYLEHLNLADNMLTFLPQEISSLRGLQTLYVYNNRLTSVPHRLLKNGRLRLCLLEGNPLSVNSLLGLVDDVAYSQIQTLGLDDEQFSTLCDYSCSLPEILPPSITVGSLIHVETSKCIKGMYLKLQRASQLRRASGVAVAGGPGGPLPAHALPADVLVVAFGASQGEPEWLGLLRTLTEAGNILDAKKGYPPPENSLELFLGGRASEHVDCRFRSLWDGCPETSAASDGGKVATDEDAYDIPDFDVLCVCDARMRWYAEDPDELQQVLDRVCMRYEKRLFVGASMGGFGAMLHGARLADTVLAFGPQSLLGQAVLRPPAADMETLLKLHSDVRAAVRTARLRGARVEVHCAADTHLENALALPLDDFDLTVHPLCPRTPFARLMERAGVLWPIVASAMVRLEPAQGATDESSASISEILSSSMQQVCVARWGNKRCLRYWTSRAYLLEYFFGRGAPNLPRPSDWFCARCASRNNKSVFFCMTCGNRCRTAKDWRGVPTVADPGTCRVADEGYPRVGDWGCGVCGTAMQRRDYRCSQCGTDRGDPRHKVV